MGGEEKKMGGEEKMGCVRRRIWGVCGGEKRKRLRRRRPNIGKSVQRKRNE
jgi:hypothetical protein